MADEATRYQHSEIFANPLQTERIGCHLVALPNEFAESITSLSFGLSESQQKIYVS